MPVVYVPQLGDEVVYLQVGHQKFLSDNNNKMLGPWTSMVSTQVRFYCRSLLSPMSQRCHT